MDDVRVSDGIGVSSRHGQRPMAKPLPMADLEHVMRHTADVWPMLDGARLFITGGTGFFGIWLLESLIHAVDRLGLDIRVTLLSRCPEAFRARMPHLGGHVALKWIEGDVRHFRFPKGRFTHVIHAATDSSDPRGDTTPLACFDTIVNGSRRVLEFAASAGVRDFLFTSSGAVYGRQPITVGRVREEYRGGPDMLHAASAYAEGKRAAEQLCAIFHEQTTVVPKIARCFAFVGPHLPLNAHFAVGNFIRDALESDTILVSGDGTPRRSYLYAADLVVWLWTILVRGAPMRAYNVGSDEAVSIGELAQRVSRCTREGRTVRIARPLGDAPAECYVPDIERARGELGLEMWHDLCLSLQSTMAWHLDGAEV